ncbi:MAG: alkaline phosphatase family protein [Terriglobales bacterium]
MTRQFRTSGAMRSAGTLFRCILFCTLAVSSCRGQARTFKHVVVILQENRTPDNVFGSNPNFEPGVDLATSGLTSKGETVPLTPIPFQTCFDLNHSHLAYVTAYNGGKMDGADKNTTQPAEGCIVPPLPQYRYIDNSTGVVQPYFDIAKQYGWSNRNFQTNQGPSFAAHQFFLAGTSAPTTYSKLFVSGNPVKEPAGCTATPDNKVTVIDEDGDENSNPPIYPCFEHPTLPDVLNAAGISWRYYSDSPDSIWDAPNSIKHMCEAKENRSGSLDCTGPDWVSKNVIGSHRVLTDIKNCNLAQVTWVTPSNKESDHPRMTDGRGPGWVASVLNALGSNSPCSKTGEVFWEDTAIFITWDDWGGWYDHVKPFRQGQSNGWGRSYTYGFRVPLLVVSAYTPAGFVDNEDHDSGSLLKFVETNFAPPGRQLGPIGPGTYSDAYADNSLQAFFTLSSPRPFKPIHVNFYFRFFVLDQEDRGRRIFEEMARCGLGCWF